VTSGEGSQAEERGVSASEGISVPPTRLWQPWAVTAPDDRFLRRALDDDRRVLQLLRAARGSRRATGKRSKSL